MLRLTITNEQRQRISKKYTDNAEAYQLYLKGRHYQLKDTPEDLKKSRQYFEQAIDADPNYALAYAGLAGYYGFMGYSGELSPKEAWPPMEASARRAEQLDPELAAAHRELAAVSLIAKWDWVGTETEIRRSIALDSNDAGAHFTYSMLLRTMHRFDEAVGEAKRLVAHLAGRKIDHGVMSETAHVIARLRVGPEGQEGVRAFLDRRAPNWMD